MKHFAHVSRRAMAAAAAAAAAAAEVRRGENSRRSCKRKECREKKTKSTNLTTLEGIGGGVAVDGGEVGHGECWSAIVRWAREQRESGRGGVSVSGGVRDGRIGKLVTSTEHEGGRGSRQAGRQLVGRRVRSRENGRELSGQLGSGWLWR